MALLDNFKKILKMCGHAFTITVHDRLETMEQRQAETDNVVLRASLRLAEQVQRSGRYEVIPSEDPKNFHPALALARHLYSIFPSHGARVMGCDAGWSEELARMGYVIDGAEPLATLLVATGIDHAQIGMLNDRPSVVVTDLEAAAADRAKQMKVLGYSWYIVLEHPKAGGAGRFYANTPIVLPEWRGDTIFFRDHATFLYALHWCEAVLRQVYFGPAEEGE